MDNQNDGLEQSYSVERSDDITHIRFLVPLSFTELATIVRRVLSSDPTHKRVWDFSAIQGTITGDQTAYLAEESQALFPPDSLIAVVVGDDLGYGQARMFQAYASNFPGREIGVFRSLTEAMDWLRSPTPED